MKAVLQSWSTEALRRALAISLTLAMMCLLLPATGTLGVGEARAEDKKSDKLSVGPGFSQAVLATQLALQGEKRKSPILLLAAAELVRDLKQSARQAKGTKLEGDGAKSSEKDALKLSVAELADKAKTYAKKDKSLSALVQKRAEQLTSRGLDPRVGEKLTSVQIKDITYKIVGGGRISAFGSGSLNNVPFVENKVAMVAAIGENSMDSLTIEVRDQNGKVIQNPPNVTARFLTVWIPFRAEAYNVTVRNNGPEQKVAILANWD